MALVPNTTKTLSDMRAAVYFLVREDEDVFTNAEVNRALNAGLMQVYDVTHQEPEIIYTTTYEGIREYDIPEARMHEGRAIVDGVYLDDEALTSSSYVYLESDAENDEPTSYYIVGRKIGLEPTPDGEYKLTIIYRRDITALSLDTDATTLNDIEVDAAIYFAAYMLKTVDEEFESATMFKNLYDETLARLTLIKPGIYKDGTAYGNYGGAE